MSAKPKIVSKWPEMRCAIFDIDGTLADITHRREHVATKPKNWTAFKAAAHLDTPVDAVSKVRACIAGYGYKIVLCSGRGEDERAVTEDWLRRHFMRYDKLYMRTEGDYRADDIVKEELLDLILADGFEPFIVFDDRDRVVAMWRRRGLVCAQVAPGNF